MLLMRQCCQDDPGPAHGGSPRPNKAIVDGSGHVSGWPGGGTKAPCSSAVLTTPGHLYVPFAKRRKRLSSPFQGGKHCHPYNSRGDSAYARMRQSVSVWCCFATECVGWVSHKPHTTRLWDVMLMPDAGNAFNLKQNKTLLLGIWLFLHDVGRLIKIS